MEDLLEERTGRLLTEHLLEPREVPGPGHAGFGVDANEAAEALIAT